MAIADTPSNTAEAPYLPPISAEELQKRNLAAIALLDSWERDGDQQEQHETMEVLRVALGRDRSLSTRKHFPCPD